MAEAEVGDDGYGEDPTVRALEELYAELVDKPAAVFVPSGTMANQVAVRVLARPGTAILAGRRQHLVSYEHGAAAWNAGVQLIPLDDTDGAFSATEVAWALSAADHHQPQPSMVSVEHTHMAAGGVVWRIPALEAVRDAAAGLPIHMDGARLFNAVVAASVPAARFASTATTVMSCLSKGLCAPVGSVLAGPPDVIESARIERQRLGGRMRQAGIVAAAGLVALRTMVDRLAEDHERARRLADVVAERWPEAGCDPNAVQTNIVVFRHEQASRLIEHLAASGVLAGTIAPGVVRLVTHRDIDDVGLERAMKALAAA
jgi:threonine aldolase